MYDYFEFLGRGIIAARTQRYPEAQKYLKLAGGQKRITVVRTLGIAHSNLAIFKIQIFHA